MILVLPYPVSANRYWATRCIRNKHTGQYMALTYVTSEAQAYKREVALLAKSKRVQRIDGPVSVDIHLYPNRPQDYARRARKDPDGWWYDVMCIDLDNARKVLNDALKEIAFGDDKWIKSDSGRVCEPDEHGARVVVTILPLVKERIAPELFA